MLYLLAILAAALLGLFIYIIVIQRYNTSIMDQEQYDVFDLYERALLDCALIENLLEKCNDATLAFELKHAEDLLKQYLSSFRTEILDVGLRRVVVSSWRRLERLPIRARHPYPTLSDQVVQLLEEAKKQ